MRRIALLAMTGFLAAAAGCSKSADVPPVEAVTAAPTVLPPDASVRQFLEAIRVGDHKQAELMLTDVARQKTAEADLMVAPPGSATAKFEIAEMEVIENQLAHVASIWTDIGDDGRPQRNEFVWALRMQPQGWRIAGVAVQLFPNQPPLLLDFEDPADMLRKQQMAAAEAQRQMQQQTMQAGGGNTAATNAAPGSSVVPTGGFAPATQPGTPSPTDPNAPNVLQGANPAAGTFSR